MKKIITTLFVFFLLSVTTIINAQNYSGSLTVYVNDQAQPTTQNTVTVTKSNGTAVLKISNFAILNYADMNIELNSALNGTALSTPATVSVTPAWIAFVLGNLQITESNIGTLDDNACTLNLKMYTSNLKQQIKVVFDGTKK